MELFTKVVGDDGQERLEPVDLEAIVENSTRFARAAEALKQANKEAATLRIKFKDGVEPVAPPVEATATSVTAPAIDLEQIVGTVRDRIRAEEQAAQEQRKQRTEQIRNIATKHGLTSDPEVIEALSLSQEPEKLAEVLARGKFRFDETLGGVPDRKTAFDDLLSRIDKRLDLQ